ncbi:hypothetical protein NDI52_28395 [Leptolyngbya sp. PL-A3]
MTPVSLTHAFLHRAAMAKASLDIFSEQAIPNIFQVSSSATIVVGRFTIATQEAGKRCH